MNQILINPRLKIRVIRVPFLKSPIPSSPSSLVSSPLFIFHYSLFILLGIGASIRNLNFPEFHHSVTISGFYSATLDLPYITEPRSLSRNRILNKTWKIRQNRFRIETPTPWNKNALGRRPNTPQVEQLSGARDGQSDEGAPARPMHHLAVKRGVWAGDRRRACEPECPKIIIFYIIFFHIFVS